MVALAMRQRGLVTAEQLRTVGVNDRTIRRWLRSGRLHRLRRGVYLVGHSVAPEGAAEMAAVLACGAGSVISHQSAARLFELRAFVRWDEAIVVTLVGRCDPGRKAGIRVHRVLSLDRRDIRVLEGIPVTAPARTLLDLAGVLPFHELERSFADARARGLVRSRDLRTVIERYPRRPGSKSLRRLLELDSRGGPSRSEAERKMRRLVSRAELPSPQMNMRVAGVEVDFVWRKHRVIVEVDGFAYHSGRDAYENDRDRDARVVAAGYPVTRVTWRPHSSRAAAVAGRIGGAAVS
jgi:very-short-patch-repair endonuclease